MKRKKIYLYSCLILKYLFALLFPVLAAVLHGVTWRYTAAALAEVILIAFLTNLLCHVKNGLGYAFNALALLMLNAQFAVLYWGSTFVSAVMLTNLDSVNAISGKAFAYGLTVAAVLLFSFLPVCALPGGKKLIFVSGAAAAILYFVAVISGITEYSPYHALFMLYQQMERYNKKDEMLSDAVKDMTESVESAESNLRQQAAENEFFSDSVSDYIKKPENLPESPNVILIFVEGMSQNIVDDPRGIMPHVASLQDNAICFADYYNHTFATYMGLSGQLYSDYQRENYDINPLVSMQDIFKDCGYETVFINTEPGNGEFSEYLANFGFDELLADEGRVDGMADALSDKAAFEMLFETALERNTKESPFFLVMYSFGTHASLDGVYERFADGSNALLNRFYDLDVQIGTFLKRFYESELAENTIIVLTSDHATYQDADFVMAFPEYERADPSVDSIPLIISYQGVTPEKYEACGRNSLDMAPTILDFLDMPAPNYFLGDSLFAAESGSFFDTYFESVGICYDTAGGEVRILSAEQMQEFDERLAKYYAVKFSDDQIYKEFEEAEHVYARVRDDLTGIAVELYNAEEWDMISYALWSEEGEQDDLRWFSMPGSHTGSVSHELDLSGYSREGVYYIHGYGNMKDSDEMVFLGEAKVYVGEEK